MSKRIAVILTAVAVCVSCATAPDARDSGTIQAFLAGVDAVDVASIVDVVELPFVYDDEVLDRESDVTVLWRSLKEGGFLFGSVNIDAVTPVTNPRDFGVGFALEALGRRLVGKPVSIVEAETADGFYILYVEDRGFGRLSLRGLRGPM